LSNPLKLLATNNRSWQPTHAGRITNRDNNSSNPARAMVGYT
jgi:hypothetical protein